MKSIEWLIKGLLLLAASATLAYASDLTGIYARADRVSARTECCLAADDPDLGCVFHGQAQRPKPLFAAGPRLSLFQARGQ